METFTFIKMCRESIAKDDACLLELAVGRFAEYCFKEPTDAVIDDDIVYFLCELLSLIDFLNMDGSWHLLMLIEYDWSAFTERQRTTLLGAIELSFDKFADPMSWFVLSEVLGEYYCSAPALEVLHRLGKLSDDGPRTQVPHGLEHIAKTTSDATLHARAVDGIMRMQSDRSDAVRQEVMNSIARLKAVKKL